VNLIAADRSGPVGEVPVLLLHAGVCDRRMWDPLWSDLTAVRDVVRVDLRGFGESTTRPDGPLDHPGDVRAVLAELGVDRVAVVGVSFGAGVAVELALVAPELVASLLLVTPGGSLIGEMTPQLRQFALAEDAALDGGDLDAAVEANLVTWVDGPGQPADRVDAGVRRKVGEMQRRAFEVTGDWGDLDEVEVDALSRLDEIRVPTTVLSAGLDVDAIAGAADAVVAGVEGAVRVEWPDVAHLPPLERPDRFRDLLLDWLASAPG
jgi:pimeloyl-ACP methyl ester carboxylesterase